METKSVSVIVKQVKDHKWNRIEMSSSEMNSIVGGIIDNIALPNNIDIWLNDEGIINEENLNLYILWGKEEHQPLFGTVIFAGYDENGKTLSLTSEQAKWIANRLKLVALNNGKHVFAIDLMEEGVIA